MIKNDTPVESYKSTHKRKLHMSQSAINISSELLPRVQKFEMESSYCLDILERRPYFMVLKSGVELPD
jgi:hypothetical protein